MLQTRSVELAMKYRVRTQVLSSFVDKPGTLVVDEDCLLYTSDAADERSSVDLGGRRIIKKKKKRAHAGVDYDQH
mgnify:CR=1 FL=1